MAKFVVIYADGSNGLQNDGYADELPEDYVKYSKGVYGPSSGSLADGDPFFIEVLETPYVPEE